MIWFAALCRVFYGLLVLMVGSLWWWGYYMLWGVAVAKPEMVVSNPTRGVYESSMSTYEMTMGAHMFLSLVVLIIALTAALLALAFWWFGFRRPPARATQSLIIGMTVIWFPMLFMGPSALKVLPYAGEVYDAVQYHKAPVTIYFNPDGTHIIKPME
jgi:hypothetical protein